MPSTPVPPKGSGTRYASRTGVRDAQKARAVRGIRPLDAESAARRSDQGRPAPESDGASHDPGPAEQPLRTRRVVSCQDSRTRHPGRKRSRCRNRQLVGGQRAPSTGCCRELCEPRTPARRSVRSCPGFSRTFRRQPRGGAVPFPEGPGLLLRQDRAARLTERLKAEAVCRDWAPFSLEPAPGPRNRWCYFGLAYARSRSSRLVRQQLAQRTASALV